MKFCSNCGAELTNEGVCLNCGAVYQKILHVRPKPNMIEAYVSMWKNYVNFSGRARRSEYWYVALANMIISLVLSFCLNPISHELHTAVSCLYSLATLVPGLSLCVRRLHDIGKSAHTLWLLLAMIIPLVNLIIIVVLIVFYCKDSNIETNKYGESNKYYYN